MKPGSRQLGRMRRERGLSMIEVLAAMVIFASSAVVLFSWIGQTADRLTRLKTEQQQLLGSLAALDYLRALNPMATPSGQAPLGDWTLRWEAQPVGEAQMVRNEAGGDGAYLVRLYLVRASARLKSGTLAEQSLYLTGWQQLRETRNVLPFAR